MNILTNSITKLCAMPPSSIIVVTAAVGFINYYFMFAVKVRIN